MKKILATILALTMIVGMSLTAFATNYTEPATGLKPEDTVEIGVTAEFTDRGADVYTTVYSVNVSWEEMNFEYSSAKTTYTWNPSKLDYDVTDTAAAGWNKPNATITVTNRSNAKIVVEATATGNFTVTQSIEVASADTKSGENGVGQEQTGTIVVTPPASIDEDVTATVTLTIKTAA